MMSALTPRTPFTEFFALQVRVDRVDRGLDAGQVPACPAAYRPGKPP